MRKILIKLLGLDVPFTQIKIELSELHRRLDFIQEQFKKNNMTHNIIKTENYLLVVDDSEIKYDDHFIDEYKMLYMLKTESTEKYKSVKKVISHLPLNNSPVLEGVPLLPPLEDDDKEVWEQGLGAEIEKLLPYMKHLDDGQYNSGQLVGFEIGATWGYNKTKEKYKYTEFDIIKAFEYGWNQRHYGKIDENELLKIQKIFIQSLQQPKMPVAFECLTFDTGNDELDGTHILGIRTTTNSQGQTEWVGKYIY